MMGLDNTDLLRRSTPPELASHLHHLLKEYPEHQISRHLFDNAEKEAISPQVLYVWLCIVKSPDTLLEALKQDFSVSIRLLAIKRLAKVLQTRAWKEIWDGIGGTSGLLSLLGQFSVAQVKTFVRLMRGCVKGPDAEERGKRIADLLRGLLPSVFPSSTEKTLDERPFVDSSGSSCYAALLPACHPQFVDQVLRDGENSLLDYPKGSDYVLLHTHHKLLRQYCKEAKSQDQLREIDYLKPLTRSIPPTPGSIPGYSESMLFSMDILRELIAKRPKNVRGETFILENLIQPLIKRAWNRRRRLGWQQLEEIVDLCFKYLDANPEECSGIDFQRKSFFYYIVLLWEMTSSEKPSFNQNIVFILQKMSFDESRFWINVTNSMSWVRQSLRYRLLQLTFIHYGKRQINIENDRDLKKLATGWPQAIFTDMDQDKALQLLRRLRQGNGNEFLGPSSGTRSDSILKSDLSYGHLPILLGVVGDPDSVAADLKIHIEAALRSREQPQRAYHAKIAMFCAIATGSLKIYGETMKWARRYVKDPLTVKSLFANNVVVTREGLALLSGIPQWPGQPQQLSASAISARVIESNEIMLAAIETVCLALKEPSFYRPDWQGLLDLFSYAVNLRLHRTASLQKELNLSDDRVYELIWSDTLSVALKIENICLRTGYDKLFQCRPIGPLLITSQLNSKTVARKPFLRFVDNLAKERDSIWKPFRQSFSSSVTILSPSLPRGLPIQLLVGNFRIDEDWAAGMTPFIFSRAEAVVFPKPRDVLTAVPEDESLQFAIGPFVDSFCLALQIYVKQSSTTKEHEKRKNRAWTYALEKLSPGRIDQNEAHRFWEAIFRRAGFHDIAPPVDPATSMEYPLLPEPSGSNSETMEWNPADSFSPPFAVSSRSLQTTYLDCSISASSQDRPAFGKSFYFPRPHTESFNPPDFRIWDHYRLSKREKSIPAVREGISASAMLYIDSKIKGPRSIFTTSFPSPPEPRYPSLYLADEFLQRSDISTEQALSIIKGQYVDTIAPTVLMNLARGALDALSKEPSESSEFANMENLAFRLLLLVTQSDRPHLATDLVLKTIIDRPDASSWHRQLISKKFLNRLSSIHARDLIRNFATAIQEKLREQEAHFKNADKDEANSTSTSTSTSPKRPYVKITTVKQLAQLLNDSTFAPESFAIEILTELLQKSHVDIRIAVIESLSSMLAGCSDEYRGYKIISTLETTIPIASAIHERGPISEEEWEEAVRTKSPPKVFEEGISTALVDMNLPPILNAIAVIATNRNTHMSEKWRSEVFNRILLPIIQRSIASNRRWLEIFAAKHRINLKSLDIPILPVYPRILMYLLQVYDWDKVPPALLALYHHFIITNLSPSTRLHQFTMTFKDPRLRNLPETRQWISLYGRCSELSSSRTFDSMIFNNYLPRALHDWDISGHEGDDGIQLPQVKEYAFVQATTLLLGHPETNHFAEFMDGFRHSPGSLLVNTARDEIKINSLGRGEAVIERIIAYIDSLRTTEWQRNPAREPSVLPSTLKYRLWLLPYPPPLSRDSKPEKTKVREFVHVVLRFIKEIISDNRPYHDDLTLIRAAVLEVIPYYYVDVACFLGHLDGYLGLEKLLCIEIAQVLFETAIPPKDNGSIRKAREVIASWQRSDNEAVRMRGRSVARKEVYKDTTWRELLLGAGENFIAMLTM